MNIRIINHQFSVSGPLNRDELKQLADAGVKTLINGRPDFEEQNQVPDAVLRVWAQDAGLDYYFIPVISGQYSPTAVAEFGRALLNAKAPIHAMCRSGTRVLHLWALARLEQGLTESEIKLAGDGVGVDLENVINGYRHSLLLKPIAH